MGKSTRELMAAAPDVEVWAAGGVIWRVVDGRCEFVLVRRESHDDWTFPKGKLDEGETLRACALREVVEETGFVCATDQRLTPVRYVDARGRPKSVVYWTMQVESGEFVPNEEIDALGWFDQASAAATLSYRHDVELLSEAAASVTSSTITP